MAFHLQPQIASDLGCNVAHSSNPYRNRKQFPSGKGNFGLWPQIQNAARLNPLRFENRKPNPPLYYEAPNYYTNHSETILLCDRCACNWKINSQRILVCDCRIHRKYLIEAPELHKRSPARKPCVTDVLCNWELDSQAIKTRELIFGPLVLEVV